MIAPLLACSLLACSLLRPDPCAKYADDAQALAWCRVEQAQGAATISEAQCEGLGAREEEACRVRWIQAHAEADIDTLLAACATDECRFVALDWHPSPITEQLQRCSALGMLADPCKAHAAVRYFAARPSIAQQREELAALTEHHKILADQAGTARYCGFEVDCAFYGIHTTMCAQIGRFGRAGAECNAFRPNFPRP